MTCHASFRSRAVTAAGPNWHGVLGACLDQLEPLPAGANLGIVYLSDWLAPMADDVLRALRERTGVGTWFGACSPAVLGGPGGASDRGLAVLVTSLPEAGFRVTAALAPPESPGGLLLAHAEMDEADPARSLADLARCPAGTIVGGLTAAGRSPVHIAGGSIGSSATSIGFAPDLPILAGMARAGSPLGPAHRVTSAIGCRILALDGRPALDVLTDELGDLFRRAGAQAAPGLWLAEPGPGEEDEYRMRRITDLDRSSGALQIEGGRPGGIVRLMRPDPAASLARVSELARRLRDGLGGRQATAGLYLASRHRGRELFGPGVDELALLRQELGGLPLIGLVTDAEIFDGAIHEAAGVLVLIG
ncbi:FIST N-terminal domain-containing protein [Geminicoccaceae bacterium SYSU G07066]|uniref:FIST N-terminal domain-containing protein n=1 Tax=Benzoatithermus flavus TaxID=3108223 RepID=A0ABU8XM90_9PROT